ncbi:uncharacterized protein LOC130640995 isoform X2 [Hydractinia symbiolongicarpus]|uniref:uncharacterized protein LOC130640995 isoform X2 n=1 Tax=Hydractinia symbiolongicarpus TaxID=13093 RepID=UPI002551AC37|nr:uncharacterized protein LOC130640995 isoform X2 [Hydractinia symbiolongicarpus]
MELTRMSNYGDNSLIQGEGDENDFFSSNDSNAFHTTIESCLKSQKEDEDGNITHKAIQIADMLERTAFQLRSKVKVYENMDQRTISRARRRRIPVRVAENIFVITLVLQCLCLTTLALVDALASKFVRKQHTSYIAAVAVMVIFQFSNLLISLAFTVKLTKQYMHHTATMKFLLQSYLSTLFLFGGIYTLIARVMPKAFNGVRGHRAGKYFSLELYSELLFTSISTGTLCVLQHFLKVLQVLLLFTGYLKVLWLYK